MSATRTYLSKARARHRELCDRARTLPPELQPIVSEALDEFVFALTMLEAGEMERWSGRTAEQPPRDVPAHAWADAMERLMREAAFYRALLTCTPVAVSLVSPDGFIRYSSPGVTTVLGFGPEELEGEDLFELIHPEDRPGARARCQRLLQDPNAWRWRARWFDARTHPGVSWSRWRPRRTRTRRLRGS